MTEDTTEKFRFLARLEIDLREDLKKYIMEHDLYKLFQMIEVNEQEALLEEYNRISKEPIERETYLQGIEEIKDTFSQFRYCFELKGFALK